MYRVQWECSNAVWQQRTTERKAEGRWGEVADSTEESQSRVVVVLPDILCWGSAFPRGIVTSRGHTSKEVLSAFATHTCTHTHTNGHAHKHTHWLALGQVPAQQGCALEVSGDKTILGDSFHVRFFKCWCVTLMVFDTGLWPSFISADN